MQTRRLPLFPRRPASSPRFHLLLVLNPRTPAHAHLHRRNRFYEGKRPMLELRHGKIRHESAGAELRQRIWA